MTTIQQTTAIDEVLTAIDHVGIVVADLDEAIGLYESTFGARLARRERIDHDGVEEALMAVGDSFVQLLTPTRSDSAVAKFLTKHGPGLHHVGYRVDDCGEALTQAVGAGMTALDAAPRPGSRGTTVAFLHPKTALGTLIELVQTAPDEPGDNEKAVSE
jgi:methylmalonyl-CoA/ethylmalonyl-CoA epimerase